MPSPLSYLVTIKSLSSISSNPVSSNRPTLYYFILVSHYFSLRLQYIGRNPFLVPPAFLALALFPFVLTHCRPNDCSKAQICYYYSLPSNSALLADDAQTFANDVWNVLSLIFSNSDLFSVTHLTDIFHILCISLK